ncbi:hypothetical protein [Kitasatospora sp. NPDC088134]|uniref:hypothetical protein n=1 Tax=Kitasatospora sp. NPDC088134 TaxID=3364071 RepID=UPI0038177AE4
MKYTVLQVLGVALLVLGAQGAIRRLVHHEDAGLLGWLPGGFAVGLTAHLLAAAAGACLAGWAHRAAKDSDSRD